jgi:hypothetical protein
VWIVWWKNAVRKKAVKKKAVKNGQRKMNTEK